MSQELKITLIRNKGDGPYEETHTTPYYESMRVLGALRHIQEQDDGTLAFRWNCGEGICGSCAIEMNGKPILACKTPIPPNITSFTIGPLTALPTIKDLIYDRTEVDQEAASLLPYFVTTKEHTSFWEMHEREVQDAAEMKTCIDCLICHDSCHVKRDTSLPFMGPRNIVKAMSLEKHPFNTENRTPLLKKAGLQQCNVTRCCTDNCPQGIEITPNAIIPFKEKVVSTDFVPFWRLSKKKK